MNLTPSTSSNKLISSAWCTPVLHDDPRTSSASSAADIRREIHLDGIVPPGIYQKAWLARSSSSEEAAAEDPFMDLLFQIDIRFRYKNLPDPRRPEYEIRHLSRETPDSTIEHPLVDADDRLPRYLQAAEAGLRRRLRLRGFELDHLGPDGRDLKIKDAGRHGRGLDRSGRLERAFGGGGPVRHPR